MSGLFELLCVLEDARLAGEATAVARVGATVAEQLGVSSAGADRFGLWAMLEVGGVQHRLRWLWPGRYVRGAAEDEEGREAWEASQHEVELTRGLWLGEVPVTQALYQAVVGDNPSRFVRPGRPVEMVSWEDCQRFCQRLVERVPGLQPRLPTETEWEYACRAGTTTPRYGPPDEVAWCRSNSTSRTHPVAQKRPNAWGLYDMLGNVWEWCQDATELAQYEAAKPPTRPEPAPSGLDPLHTQGSKRVFRGGAWSSHARYVRAAYRLAGEPSFQNNDLGFRLTCGALGASAREGSVFTRQ